MSVDDEVARDGLAMFDMSKNAFDLLRASPAVLPPKRPASGKWVQYGATGSNSGNKRLNVTGVAKELPSEWLA